eukprot:NODE_3868_length_1151_cov_126.651751_g3681_i0.p1 GENE.NODE_3868_length_1151_cov_126.651751_g3681_i0~~NODE_3868_length_1151_cov_126.651751_g3681_i0.p1  ORF type:complete len:318 (+),score=39.21 NODE_3868_length_1151_cov_126.651751_g3681_i0:51-956(+)
MSQPPWRMPPSSSLPLEVTQYTAQRAATLKPFSDTLPQELKQFDRSHVIPSLEIKSAPTAPYCAFHCLAPPIRELLLSEMLRYETTVPVSDRVDPTLYHDAGGLCRDMGLANWCAGLIKEVLSPIAADMFGIAELDPSDFSGFIIRTRSTNGHDNGTDVPWHKDESVITVNICLEAEAGCSDVIFKTDSEGTILVHKHAEGLAIMHPGSALHATAPDSNGLHGFRSNLVLYLLPSPRCLRQGIHRGPPFYEQYERYLSQKHLAGSRHMDFAIPMLPPWAERFGHTIEAFRKQRIKDGAEPS